MFPVTTVISPVVSEIVEFPNANGQKIVAYLDHAESGFESRPWVVMSPKYGETKKNNLQLGYFLAANEVNVLRFDHTNHVGESDGDISGFTFPGAVADICACIDFLERQFGVEDVSLISASLSVRSALRAVAVDRRICCMVSLVGVVNFQETLIAVYQKDLVGDHIRGEFSGITDILGHQVNVAHFMESCIREKMHTLAGSMADLAKSNAKAFFFYGENDVWVNAADIAALVDARPETFARAIPDAMHEIRENPQTAERTMREIVFTCRYGRLPEGMECKEVRTPDKRQLFKQNRIERERLRELKPIAGTEKEFWRAYLGKYDILEKVGDYREYLDCVGTQLGTISPGQIVFDCGCGNGLFGVWVIRDLLRRGGSCKVRPPMYVGLDLTEKGLSDALGKHTLASHALRPPSGVEAQGAEFAYTSFDLDQISDGVKQLPFADETFDKICCSLLISYLKKPEALMKELYRVLRPGGTIVVSSMKPFCDLSVIYRDFLGEKKEQDLDSARNLMSAAGAIKLKEEHGQYIFFDQKTLTDLCRDAGFRRIRSFRSFGDQANVASASK